MMSFRGNYLGRLTLPVASVWLASDVAEAKGRRDLYLDKLPETLTFPARDGPCPERRVVEPDRGGHRRAGPAAPARAGGRPPQGPLGGGDPGVPPGARADPRGAKNLAITPELLQRLHSIIQEGSGDAGQWKRVDNEIVELREGAPPLVRFRPVKVAETPAAVEELCLLYRHALNQSLAPPIVAVAVLIFDFLCIHPFRDGNGRVSRLLTLLALCQHGYEVGGMSAWSAWPRSPAPSITTCFTAALRGGTRGGTTSSPG
jgi:hypothetical protein